MNTRLLPKLRYCLLQVRNRDDSMREQEVGCFARTLGCDASQIEVFDLLRGAPSASRLRSADVVLLGGSGDYSVAQGGPWLQTALDAMRRLHDDSKPTFASCWGFQAMARALGGRVVTDLSLAELGTLSVRLTPEGLRDPVFGPLGPTFPAQIGHQDIVVSLPPDAVLLASSERVANEAFRFAGKPIYCTQFHPELDRAALMERVRAYPSYVERIAGVSIHQFARRCAETPQAAELLPRFVLDCFGGS